MYFRPHTLAKTRIQVNSQYFVWLFLWSWHSSEPVWVTSPGRPCSNSSLFLCLGFEIWEVILSILLLEGSMTTRGKQLPDRALCLHHGQVPLSGSDSKGLSKILSSINEANFCQALSQSLNKSLSGSLCLWVPLGTQFSAQRERDGLCVRVLVLSIPSVSFVRPFGLHF